MSSLTANQLLDSLPLKSQLYPVKLQQQLAEACDLICASEPSGLDTNGLVFVAPPQDQSLSLPATMPELIALCGSPRSGKDVVADYLEETYHGVKRFAFSDVIIAEANSALRPYGHEITPENKSGPGQRLFLQVWGLGRRIENPDYWIDSVRRRIAELRQSGPRLIVASGARVPLIDDRPDLRELDLIRAEGGEIWRVDRPGNPYHAEQEVEIGLALLDDTHFDRILSNNHEGDLAAFIAEIESKIN